MTDQVTRDRRRQRLEDHIAEIVDHAQAHGWTVHTEPIEIEDDDVERAVGIGALREDRHPDDDTDRVEWMFTTVVALRRSTGRVITLVDDDRGGARVVVEPDGFGRYWRGGANAWRGALADPQGWCRGWWPTSSDRITARIRKSL